MMATELILCHGESVSEDITEDYLSTCRYQQPRCPPVSSSVFLFPSISVTERKAVSQKILMTSLGLLPTASILSCCEFRYEWIPPNILSRAEGRVNKYSAHHQDWGLHNSHCPAQQQDQWHSSLFSWIIFSLSPCQ